MGLIDGQAWEKQYGIEEKLNIPAVIKRFCSCGKELEEFETGNKCYDCLKNELQELKSKYGL
jgi:hypothetical protein